MRRATVLLGIVFALAASLMTAIPATADSNSVSPSDQHSLNYINQQPAVRVNILLNAKATHWYASHTKNAFQYLGFGWYTVRVTKAQARFVFTSLPDGWVNPNHAYHVASDTSTPQGVRGPSNSPEVADFSTIIGAKNVNNDGNRGAGQTVAIIDTGIYDSHPFFKNTAGTASRIVAEVCYVNNGQSQSYPCLNGQSSDFSAHAADISGASPTIQNGLEHGTHVAGIAAGNKDGFLTPVSGLTNGVAPDAGILPIRVFGGDSAYDVDILSAMAWVTSHAAQYNIASVNLSLGSDPDYQCTAQTVQGYSSYLSAFTSLTNAGVAPLVASGNDGAGTNNSPWNVVSNPTGLGIGVPACINPAISVASSDFNDVISWFSDVSYDIDVAAPGHWIYSSVPYASDASGFTYMRGTSMATPVVAGAFALAKAASPQTAIADWLTLFKSTGTPIDDVIVHGIPRINVDQAIGATGTLASPSNVMVTWPAISEFFLTWSAPTYGPAPTGYRIQFDNTSVDVSASTFQYLGPIDHPDTVVSVRAIHDGTLGPAVSRTALPQSSQVQRVAKLFSKFIEKAYLGGDECIAPSSDRVVLQYDSPSINIRTLYLLDGEGGATQVTETKLSPAPATLTTGFARQIIIENPLTVLKSTSKIYVLDGQGRVGAEYNLSNAFSVMQSSPQSPAAVTNLQATPGRLSANVSWTDAQSSTWRLYVDGVSQGNVSSRNLSLPLAAGSHTIGVCAVASTVNGEYSSVVTQTTFSVQSKLTQSISASGPQRISLTSTNATISASSTSGLGVTYSSSTQSVCTVNNAGSITAVNPGSCAVTVSQAGNTDYMSATPVVLNITVLQPQTIQIISTPALTLGSAPHVVVVSASSGLDLSFSSLSLGVCQVGETTGVVVAVGAGSCTIRVSQAGNSQYDAVTSDVSFDVLRPKASAVTSVKASVKSRKLSLSWTAPANAVNAAISKYAVKYKVGAKGKWKTVYVTSRKWTSAAFARGSRVFFILYAVSARGNGSVYSSSKVIS